MKPGRYRKTGDAVFLVAACAALCGAFGSEYLDDVCTMQGGTDNGAQTLVTSHVQAVLSLALCPTYRIGVYRSRLTGGGGRRGAFMADFLSN